MCFTGECKYEDVLGGCQIHCKEGKYPEDSLCVLMEKEWEREMSKVYTSEQIEEFIEKVVLVADLGLCKDSCPSALETSCTCIHLRSSSGYSCCGCCQKMHLREMLEEVISYE